MIIVVDEKREIRRTRVDVCAGRVVVRELDAARYRGKLTAIRYFYVYIGFELGELHAFGKHYTERGLTDDIHIYHIFDAHLFEHLDQGRRVSIETRFELSDARRRYFFKKRGVEQHVGIEHGLDGRTDRAPANTPRRSRARR